MDSAHATAEAAARASYGRLVAILSATSRDIAAAEDALADAFLSALRTWPERGIPGNPEAWLLTAARNSAKNSVRRRMLADGSASEIARRYDAAPGDPDDVPDERLKLLFVCAHPAIDEAVRTPLMLQTVLGLDAVRIGSAFLVAPSTMGQRLVRAKAKIKAAGLRFEVPSAQDWPGRLGDVLNAVYAAYGTGWDAVAGADGGLNDLTGEAMFLGRLLVALLPEEAEPRGLLALMLYCEARRNARADGNGCFVPLDRQDPRLWSRDMIIEAEGLLTSAARIGRFGRFQCEAAIQSVHVQRPIVGHTNYDALKSLYALLSLGYPSIGVLVGQAAVFLQAGQPWQALALLDAIAADRAAGYQPYWVTRAHSLLGLHRRTEAAAAFQTAIGLSENEAVRAFLRTVVDSSAGSGAQDGRAGESA